MCSFLSIAAIYKKDDPIVKTQTDPILYEQKQEEIKEGVKGAPQPVWRVYPKYRFLVEPPFTQQREEAPEEQLPLPWEPLPENVNEEAATTGDSQWYWEEGIPEVLPETGSDNLWGGEPTFLSDSDGKEEKEEKGEDGQGALRWEEEGEEGEGASALIF